jgi:transposase-like protein
VVGNAYKLTAKEGSKSPVRPGVYKCGGCREQFTVTVGTIFEDSKIPLHKWLLAIHLMCSSKKGISAHQLWRNLWGVNDEGKQLGSYRTAWFMCHRIRWALGEEPLASKLSGIVEVDETYVGGKLRFPNSNPEERSHKGPQKGQNPRSNKTPVVAILERDGNVRSMVMHRVTSDNLKPVIDALVDRSAVLMTDSSTALRFPEKDGREHHMVNHTRKEYVRHEEGLVVTTNAVEGYFGILKRGLNGTFHHVGKHYLDQYLREFDARYNMRKLNDDQRLTLACKKTGGKRLMLRQPKGE